MEQISIIASVSEETSVESLFSVDVESDAVCSPWGACVQQSRVRNEIFYRVTATEESQGQPCICGENRSVCSSLSACELLHLNNEFPCLTQGNVVEVWKVFSAFGVEGVMH